MNAPSNHHEEESIVLGFMGPPGIGKTVAMNIVENEANREELGRRLGITGPVTVDVVRKSTTRDNRGKDDRLKESGLTVGTEPGQFNPETMVGVYTLSNNGAMYGYRPEELNKKTARILIAEPSLHHLTEVEEYLGDRLTTTFLAATRQYRLDRLGSRGTEDPAEVRRRALEGDSQIIMANILNAPLGKPVEELTDAKMVELFMEIRAAEEGEQLDQAIAALRSYLHDYVQEPDEAKAAKYDDATAKNMAEELRHIHVKDGVQYIAKVITVDESFLVEDPISTGKFRDAMLAIVEEAIRSQDTKVAA